MPTFPNALLYLPASSGGLGLPRLSTYTNARKWSMAQRAITSGNDSAEAAGELLQRAARYSGNDPTYGTNAIIGPVSITPFWGGESRTPRHQTTPSRTPTRPLLLAALLPTRPQHPAQQGIANPSSAAGPGTPHMGGPHHARRAGPPSLAPTAPTRVPRSHAHTARDTMPHPPPPPIQGWSILDPPGHQHRTGRHIPTQATTTGRRPLPHPGWLSSRISSHKRINTVYTWMAPGDRLPPPSQRTTSVSGGRMKGVGSPI